MKWKIPDIPTDEIIKRMFELERSEVEIKFDDSIETEILGRIYDKLTDSENCPGVGNREKFGEILQNAAFINKDNNLIIIELNGKKYEVELKINVKEKK